MSHIHDRPKGPVSEISNVTVQRHIVQITRDPSTSGTMSQLIVIGKVVDFGDRLQTVVKPFNRRPSALCDNQAKNSIAFVHRETTALLRWIQSRHHRTLKSPKNRHR